MPVVAIPKGSQQQRLRRFPSTGRDKGNLLETGATQSKRGYRTRDVPCRLSRRTDLTWMKEKRMPSLGSAARLGLTAAILGLVACSGDATSTPPPGSDTDRLSVQLAVDSDSILLGTSKVFSARVINQYNQVRSAPVVWSSSNPGALTVAANGTVTAIGLGTSRIVAAIAGHADSATVKVFGLGTTLGVVPEAVSMAVGDDIQVQTVMANAPSGVGTSVEWVSSDTAVAMVTADGTVIGMGSGDAEIIASVGTAMAKASVNVFDVPVTAVSISPTVSSIPVNGTTTLEATVQTATGATIRRKAKWSTSDINVASVNADGVVRGKKKGYATVRATVGEKSATATINVFPSPAASVSVTLADSSVVVGQSIQATAEAKDASGNPLTGVSIAWQSSNPAIATVTSAGLVKAIATGSATISAVSGGQIGSAPVAVSGSIPTTVVILPANPTVTVGTTTQLVGEVRDQNGLAIAGATVLWSSDNSPVASISSTGLLTGNTQGNANITATSGSLTRTVAASVTAVAVASVSVAPATGRMQVGDSLRVEAVARDAQGSALSGRAVAWTSSNAAIASVNSSGVIRGTGAGSAVITATVEGKSATVSVTVDPVISTIVADVFVSLGATTLDVNQTTQAVATLKDSDGNVVTGKSVTWTSADPSLATVSAGGLVTARAAGTVSIVATSEGVSGGATVSIKAPPVASVASVSVSLSPTSINAGQTSQATVTLRDAAGNVLTGRTIGYSSSNTTVASVSVGGVVTGVSGGTVQITATSEGKTGSATLTVSGGSSTAPVASITLALNSSTLSPGQSTQASAVLKDASGNVLTGRTVTFTSSNTGVATVSGGGLVSAMTSGSAMISASSGGVVGSAALSVQSGSSTVASITVSLPSSSIQVGQTMQSAAIAKDAAGNTLSGATVSWSMSSGQSVATVSSAGLITALAVGSATVMATSNGVTGVASFNVATQGSLPQASRIATRPTLPQAFVDVTPKAVTGKTINVAAGGDLQLALNSANYGDEIVLQAGATYTGNFILPVKSGSGWILVRSNGSIPPAGTRLTRTTAGGVARIVSPNTLPTIKTAPSARGYRFVGLEITTASSVTTQTAIVYLGDGANVQTSLSMVPRDLVFDRTWVHGHSTLNVRRCISLNSASTAVINSTIDECHDSGFDSQAVWGWNGPGPFLIENNYLEGSSENVGFGGGATMTNLVPSDIIIRGNHIAKPAAWKTAKWLVKNLIEFKAGKRVLIEENLIEGNWVSGQQGYAIMLTPRSENGQCAQWCTIQDFTFRWNHVRRTGSGMNLTSDPDNDLANPGARFAFENNLWDEINSGIYSGQGRLWLAWSADLNDVVFSHNTGFAGDAMLLFAERYLNRIEVEDNIIGSTAGYGVWSGNGQPQGTATLNYHISGWTYLRNVSFGIPASVHPTGNWYPSGVTGIGFASPSTGDWSLTASSPYKGKGEGGSDPGVDYQQLKSRLAKVVVP